MKTIKSISFAVLIAGAFSMYLLSCEKDQEICGCKDESAVNYNKQANCDDGSCIFPDQLDDTTRVFNSAASGINPRIDKSHSNIRWETSYKDLGFSLLTGRFAQFDGEITFNEKDPSKTKINGWVQVSSNLTGEPGRDNPGGCMPNDLGVEWNTHMEINGTDTTVVYDSSVASTDYAYLEIKENNTDFYFANKRGFTTSYKATGTLKFRPNSSGALVESSVDVYFKYNGIDYAEGRTGFEGYFEFNAISVHGVTSTNISDMVKVLVNIQVRGL